MLPGTDLVHKRMEYTHFFTGGLVGGNRSVKPVCRYPFEFHVPCKSGDEVDAVLTVCGPVHEVVGAEVGVAPDYYLSVFPLFAKLEYQPLEKACNVDRLVSPARPENGKDELSAFVFANECQSAKRGEFWCREIDRHFLAGHVLKFKQCRESLVICRI